MQEEVINTDTKREQRPNFESFFFKKLIKDLKKFEKTRTKFLKIGIPITIAVILLIIGADIYFSGGIKKSVYAVPFIAAVWAVFAGYYKHTVKEKVLPVLLSYFGHFQIGDKSGVSSFLSPLIKELNLFHSYNRFGCDDYLTGTYKGLNTDIYELELVKETRGSNGRSHSHTVFHGILMRFKCPKNFQYTTLVKKDKSFAPDKTLKKVNLEDPEFEKYYDVYSGDQIESRSLLTPAFMNRMVTLCNDPSGTGKNIIVAFHEGYVNLFLKSSRDWFDISVMKKTTDISNYRDIINDLETIISIIDTLKYGDT